MPRFGGLVGGMPKGGAIGQILIKNGSADFSAGWQDQNSAIAITRNADGTINTITEYGVTYTFSYNSDGTVNTISNGTTTRTFTYSNGEVASIS